MNETPGRPLIRAFLDAPLSGPEIEAKSMEIIDREAPEHRFTPEEWQIVRRMIHTTGDFGIMEAVRFSPDAIAAGVAALHGCRSLIVDSNMIRSGISSPACGAFAGFTGRRASSATLPTRISNERPGGPASPARSMRSRRPGPLSPERSRPSETPRLR